MGSVVDILIDRSTGALRVPEAVYADAVAWLLLGAGDALVEVAGATDLPAEAARHLGALAERAGVTAEMDASAMGASIQAYFAAHPLPGELRTALEQTMREAASEAGALGVGDDVARLLGSVASRGVLERKAPPPPGTVAAGPMARFQVSVPKKPR